MQDLASKLVSAQYDPDSGAVRFKFGAEYFDHDFRLSPANVIKNAPAWVPQRGQYNELHGYWIFLPNANKCWQAVNTNGPLQYWNQDGLARGKPQDWELFVFEDANNGKVRIKNIYGRYINFNGGSFECTADLAGAAVFEAVQ